MHLKLTVNLFSTKKCIQILIKLLTTNAPNVLTVKRRGKHENAMNKANTYALCTINKDSQRPNMPFQIQSNKRTIRLVLFEL
jgi:hypothetical protein